MGTRSLTVIKDEENKEICVLYRQFDGYPEGHGKDLRDFLRGFSLVNGLTMMPNEAPRKIANGMACLAAQIIAHFKTEPGGFYLHPAGTRDVGEEYIYTVSKKGNKILLNCKSIGVDDLGDEDNLYWTY